MAAIRSLRPNVTREEAMGQFSRGGLGLFRQSVYGPLRSVAEFYIPFRIFQVEIVNRGKLDRRIIALDAVTGTLDPYFLDQLPDAGDIICLDTRNALDALLDSEKARQMAVTKVQRLLFTTGFFKMRDLRIAVEPVPGEICVPYWVGFRGRGSLARFTVLDAVRRREEGARVWRLLQNWLTGCIENPS
jgi:hypothetical protein